MTIYLPYYDVIYLPELPVNGSIRQYSGPVRVRHENDKSNLPSKQRAKRKAENIANSKLDGKPKQLADEPCTKPRGFIGWDKYVGQLKHEPKFQSRSKAKNKSTFVPASPFNTPLGEQIKAMQAKQVELLGEMKRVKSTRKRNKKHALIADLQAKIELLEKRLNL